VFGEAHPITRVVPAKYLIQQDFRDSLSGVAFARFSQAGGACKNLWHAFRASFSIAKTRALTDFFARLLRQGAQNPVTWLWTTCIRLKMNQIKACTFR
jgi:hypothetical protein